MGRLYHMATWMVKQIVCKMHVVVIIYHTEGLCNAWHECCFFIKKTLLFHKLANENVCREAASRDIRQVQFTNMLQTQVACSAGTSTDTRQILPVASLIFPLLQKYVYLWNHASKFKNLFFWLTICEHFVYTNIWHFMT
jgi:hypothetical protein